MYFGVHESVSVHHPSFILFAGIIIILLKVPIVEPSRGNSGDSIRFIHLYFRVRESVSVHHPSFILFAGIIIILEVPTV